MKNLRKSLVIFVGCVLASASLLRPVPSYADACNLGPYIAGSIHDGQTRNCWTTAGDTYYYDAWSWSRPLSALRDFKTAITWWEEADGSTCWGPVTWTSNTVFNANSTHYLAPWPPMRYVCTGYYSHNYKASTQHTAWIFGTSTVSYLYSRYGY